MARTYDILFLQVDSSKISPAPQKVPLSFGDPVKSVTGVQKSIQAFLSLLFTKNGESWNAAAGCGFLRVLEQGLIRTPLDAQNYFAQSVPDVIQQVNVGLTEPDEILTRAVLLSATVEQDRLALTIQLQTAAGSSVTFTAPV